MLTDSLLDNAKPSTLCLNFRDNESNAETLLQGHLNSKGIDGVKVVKEPSLSDFKSTLESLDSGVAIAVFDDLEQHPKCMEYLHGHVQKDPTKGKLIVVSKNWNPTNSDKELEIKKNCLFYQQSPEIRKRY